MSNNFPLEDDEDLGPNKKKQNKQTKKWTGGGKNLLLRRRWKIYLSLALHFHVSLRLCRVACHLSSTPWLCADGTTTINRAAQGLIDVLYPSPHQRVDNRKRRIRNGYCVILPTADMYREILLYVISLFLCIYRSGFFFFSPPKIVDARFYLWKWFVYARQLFNRFDQWPTAHQFLSFYISNIFLDLRLPQS